MAKKNPLLSWLFGAASADSKEEPEAPAKQAEAPVLPETPPPGGNMADPFRLTLASDHAVSKLWRLWTQQAGRQPPPSFRFEGLEGESEPIPAAQAKQELPGKARPKKADKAAQGKELPPPPVLDAQAVAFVTSDRLTAWVFAYPPVGDGKELDRGMLTKALGEKQVTYGIDDALLDALPSRPGRYFRLYIAARGKAAAHGKDGRVIDMFSRQPERKLVVDEFNRVDYASISFIQNAEEGDTICRIIAPTKGEDGKTVLGQDLPARDGKPASVPKGRNTALNDQGDALVATKTGHVEFNGRTFQVKPVLDIDGNVDFSTGHINFLGDVNIRGNVLSGFTVRAMGSIWVGGVIEAGSTVEAGGDLTVVKGILGDGTTTVRAQRCIFSKYIENATIYVRENLQTDAIINGSIYCDGEVLVRSGRGSIMGGKIWAAEMVSASTVGSRSECRTSIILGGLPCTSFERELVRKELKELEMELEKLECQLDSPVKASLISKVHVKLNTAELRLQQLEEDLEEGWSAAWPMPGRRSASAARRSACVRKTASASPKWCAVRLW